MAKAILSCLVMLTLVACASDYNPYVQEISSNGQVVQSNSFYYEPYEEVAYVGVSPYYPWGSIDYFYFGNHYYQSSSSLAFSVGVSYWSPWYSPYYGPFYNPYYYSAWYPGFYPWSYAYFGYGYGWGWYGRGYPYGAYYGRHAQYVPGHGYGGYGDGRGHRDGVPVANRGGVQQLGDYRSGIDRRGRQREYMTRERDWNSLGQQAPTERNVSVAPSPGGVDQGMVIINRSDRKAGQNRVQPVSRLGVVSAPAPVATNSNQANPAQGGGGSRAGMQPRFSAPPSAPSTPPAPSAAPRPAPQPAFSGSRGGRNRSDIGVERPDRDHP